MLDRILNLGLRTLALGSRFLLAILLARSMQEEEFGYYGLFSAAVGYLVYVVGIDFYTYTVRDLVARPQSAWRALLRDQFLLYAVTYSFVGTSVLLLWAGNVIEGGTVIWLMLLLASEHLAQELNRLLIICGKVLQSSIALFIRSGLWVLVLAAIWGWNPAKSLELKLVFFLWLGAGGLAILWSLWCLRGIWNDRSSAGATVNWGRLREGIRVAAIYFAGTLVLKFASTADRFLVEHFAGLSAVGPYVLYVGLGSAIVALVDAAVVVYDYPGLIRAWQEGDNQRFYALYRAFSRRILLYAVSVALILALLLHPVLKFIEKQYVTDAWPLAVPLIIANVLLSLANVPHYGLYAAQQDRSILLATTFGTAVFLFLAVLTGPRFGVFAVAWSLTLSALIVLMTKVTLWRRVQERKAWLNHVCTIDPRGASDN